MSKLLPIVVITMGILSAHAAEPFRIVLIDAGQKIYKETVRLDSSDVMSDSPVLWSVSKYVLRGDMQEGVDIIYVNNGKLSFTVVPTRGMSIQKVQMGDLRLGLDSPDKILVHPKNIDLQMPGDLDGLGRFNEWMFRSGLKLFRGPETEDTGSGNGENEKIETLREEIGLMSASQVEVVVEREAPYHIKVRGRIDQSIMDGGKFELWTEVSTEPNSNTFQISDKITNLSEIEQEFEILYHVNFGRPLIGKEAKFFGPMRRITPIDEHSASDVSTFYNYRGPMAEFDEQCYYLQFWADENNRTEVVLHNAAFDKAISMAFSIEQLPFVGFWKNPAAYDDGYVTALEPGTSFPRNKAIEREFGQAPKLSPNQSRSFIIDFALLMGKEQVSVTQTRIAKIWAGQRTKFDTSPHVSAKTTLQDIIDAARTWGPAYTTWYGEPAPDFTLVDITGTGHSLSDYRGKNVMLIFWATWCGPCLQEIPHLIELRKTVSEDDLVMLAISNERLDLVKYFVDRAKINYLVLIDQGSLPGPYNTVNAIPSSFFVDPEGKIKLATRGLISLEEIKAILEAE
jgi:peroxiredoxin